MASVASAILKVQLTEAGRRAINDGMDILGGKAIIGGPRNLLGVGYRHTPIAITVEGANLLTRALIIFGQGAVRCHPHVLAEMKAVAEQDAPALGRALLAHGGHVLRNLWRSVAGARIHVTPPPELRAEAKEIARLSAQFALTADLAMGLLGGKLKRLELLSARLGDVLSCLYLASACLWRYEVEGEPKMLPLARAAVRTQLARGALILRELQANPPSRALAFVSPLLLGGTRRLTPPGDRAVLALAEALRTDPVLIARLCPDVGMPKQGGLRDLIEALALAEPVAGELVALNHTLRRTRSLEESAAGARNPAAALAYLQAADRVIQVDDFAP